MMQSASAIWVTDPLNKAKENSANPKKRASTATITKQYRTTAILFPFQCGGLAPKNPCGRTGQGLWVWVGLIRGV